MKSGAPHLEARQPVVRASCSLSAPAEEVWALIGNFAAPQVWLPGIHGVEMQHDGVGSIRICRTTLGAFREQLTAQGPMWFRYVILEGQLPVLNYEATLIVRNTTPDSSSLLWESAFEPALPTTSGVATRLVAQLYDVSLRGLQARFGSRDPGPLFRTGILGDVPIQTFLDNSK